MCGYIWICDIFSPHKNRPKYRLPGRVFGDSQLQNSERIASGSYVGLYIPKDLGMSREEAIQTMNRLSQTYQMGGPQNLS